MQNCEENKGITVIALVITIIVLLILAGTSISMITGEDGIISHASTAKIVSELSGYKESLELFKASKIMENSDFYEGSLTSGKTTLVYNTKTDDSEHNIRDVIKGISDDYIDIMEIIKGELLLNTQDRKLIRIAQDLGIQVNPYIIVEGELMSSDTNLLLVDENGALTIPESVTKIGEGAFANVEGLKTIIIPGTVKEIGTNAFRNNTTLEKVIMQEGVESIGNSAFNSCSNLQEIEFPQSLKNIGGSAMIYCSNLDNVILPPNITSLIGHTFNACYNLKNIVLPENLERIETGVFSSCTNIENITIPTDVNFIDPSAFGNNPKLTEITTTGNENYKYENGMLFKSDGSVVCFVSDNILKSGSTFTIPEGLSNFKIDISQYGNIKKLVIPKSIKEISNGQRLPRGLEEISIDNDNETFSVENDCLYSKDKKRLIFCYSKEKDITLNQDVVTIGEFSFRGATNAENVVLPDSVKSIGGQVFDQCTKLQNLQIGSQVSYINPIFMYRDFQGVLTIDENNQYYKVKDGVIYSKNGKTLITVLYKIKGKFIVDDDVEVLGSMAFHNQTSMTEINLNNKLKEIKTSINYCHGLTSIEIPSSIETISTNAFDNSTNLKEVIIHKQENSISGSPFGCIYGLKAIKWEP